NRATFLREAGHVDDADALAFQMRGHADDGADGDDAGAADAGDDDAVGMISERCGWLRQRRPVFRLGDALAFLQFRAVHGDEGGAKTIEARIILIAARLVDGALAAPFGRQWLHRDAVRFDAAIAAAFADQIVDNHALEWIGKRAAFAAPALFGRAGLVVNKNADARHRGQFALDGVELVAVVDG